MDSRLLSKIIPIAAGLLTGFAALGLARVGTPAFSAGDAKTIMAAGLIVPTLLTVALPRPWIYFWLPAPVALYIWLVHELDQVDGPGGLYAYAFVGFFMLMNLPATAARLFFIVSALNSRYSSGYIEHD